MEIVPGLHAVRLIGVNAFLLDGDGGLTLVDAGHRGSIRALQRNLARMGRRIEDIRRIVCTHGHPDHIGGVHEIAAASGAEILLHPADRARLRISLREVLAAPAPGAIVALLTRAPAESRPALEGELLPALGGTRILHTPGHTPGSISLHVERERLLIVGDLLECRSGTVGPPNSFFSDDLDEARRSIARLAELDVETILFSHYPPLRHGALAALRAIAREG